MKNAVGVSFSCTCVVLVSMDAAAAETDWQPTQQVLVTSRPVTTITVAVRGMPIAERGDWEGSISGASFTS